MRNKRKFAKSKNKIIQIIENHVSKNIKEYAISILVFFYRNYYRSYDIK